MAGEAKPFERPQNWAHDRPNFFKYVTRSTGRAILNNTRLRWSTPVLFNDPFDIQFNLHVEADYASARRRVLDRLWDAFYSDKPLPVGNMFGQLIAVVRGVFPKLNRGEFDQEFGEAVDEGMATADKNRSRHHAEISDFMIRSKVLCLAEVNNNILMWSHYAESHKGLVLRFSCIPRLDSAWGAARPVSYSEKMPRLLDEDALVALMSGEAKIDVPEMMDRLIYTKAIDWAYEKEWRVCAGDGRSVSSYEDWLFSPEELDAVYLGCCMPEEERTEFARLVVERYPHAGIFQAEKAEREFRLEFKAVQI